MPKPTRRRLQRFLLAFAGTLAAGSAAPAAEEDAVKEAIRKPGLYAVFETTMGTIVCKLYYDKVPVTVANFVGLATGEKSWRDPTTGEMVQRPFYDGLKFHRCIQDFMVQGGCPLGNGRGGPGYTFSDEFHPELRHDGPGVLSMANSGPNTNGSQFFITQKATPWLDGKHSVFGRCVLGQDVVNAMAQVPMKGPDRSTPVEDIVIEHVRIVRTGPEAEAFDWEAEFAKEPELRARREQEKNERERTQLETLCRKLGFESSQLVETPSGLRYFVREEGTGETPTRGQTISAHYTGYLLDGTKFDSSVDRGEPIQTKIGVGRVIRGWDEAFLGMKEGGKRVIICPPELAYGTRGRPPVIPRSATLVFDVEFVGIVP